MTEVRRHRASFMKQAPSSSRDKVGTLDMLMSYTTSNPLLTYTHVVVKNKSWCIGGLANILQIDSK